VVTAGVAGPVATTKPLTAGQERAGQAIAKARKLWPGVIGEVLGDEIRYAYDLLPWSGGSARARALIAEILDMTDPPQ
jgi:hypothetical protein